MIASYISQNLHVNKQPNWQHFLVFICFLFVVVKELLKCQQCKWSDASHATCCEKKNTQISADYEDQIIAFYFQADR